MVQYVASSKNAMIKMPKRNTNSKYDVMVSFIMSCILKNEFMKPQMIQMAEDDWQGYRKKWLWPDILL